MLTEGALVPAFDLANQNDERVDVTTFRGRWFVVYFSPRANTPGCTQQACLLRRAWYKTRPKDTPVKVLEALGR